MKKILTIFGTRPEVIKLAPVIGELERRSESFRTVNVCSGQHVELLRPFVELFGTRVDHDLNVMSPQQTPSTVCARVLDALDPILRTEKPDMVLVQGDTTTAMAGALAAFYARIPCGHVEAGLRSGNIDSPFPEEMNRRVITQVATYHFAATEGNRAQLLNEGVEESRIFVTGNPGVDALKTILSKATPGPQLAQLLSATEGMKLIALTTHRREAFGELMASNLKTLRKFVEEHSDVVLIFPVHPNPEVGEAAKRILSCYPRIHLIDPLCYSDFICLLSRSWLIVSDSGGVQEEAPTLHKPLIVLRENTERPEAIQSGVAKLVGRESGAFCRLLNDAYRSGAWVAHVERAENPFGRGDSAEKIIQLLSRVLAGTQAMALAGGR